MPQATDADAALQEWIAKQSPEELRQLVRRLLGTDAVASRAEILSRIRDETDAAAWPMAEPTRTLAQLRTAAAAVGDRQLQRAQRASAAARRKRLAGIAADRGKTVANIENLVKMRSTANYDEAAQELADLREALGPELGPVRARAVAEKLRGENPRLHRLIAALRKHGLL